jgi:hypothetical protein
VKIPRVLRSFTRASVFVLTAAFFGASFCADVWAASSEHAAGEYTVIMEILPKGGYTGEVFAAKFKR